MKEKLTELIVKLLTVRDHFTWIELKARDFNATSLSTYAFSSLYTTLPYNLIKSKPIDLIERTFNRESSPCLASNDRNVFSTSENSKKYHA